MDGKKKSQIQSLYFHAIHAILTCFRILLMKMLFIVHQWRRKNKMKHSYSVNMYGCVFIKAHAQTNMYHIFVFGPNHGNRFCLTIFDLNIP